MVLICNSPDKADQLLEGLDPSHSIDPQRSAQRIAALVPTAAAMDWNSLHNDASYQSARHLVASIT
jgi:beta-N-acetylhexosaminidase